MKTFTFSNLRISQRFIASVCCLFLPSLLLCSCEKSDSDKADQYDLKEILSGSYWKEDVRFVYPDEGKDVVSKNDLQVDFDIGGGRTLWEAVSLMRFYVDSHSSAIHRYYYYHNNYNNCRYTTNEYAIHFNDHNNTFRVETPDPNLKEVNAVVGYDIKPLSVTPEQIVFEVPIKRFVFKAWRLDRDRERKPFCSSHSLRITWTRVDEAEMAWIVRPATEVDLGPYQRDSEFIREYLEELYNRKY